LSRSIERRRFASTLAFHELQVLRAVRERHFGMHRPTSTTVCVAQLASPAFLVEVEAIAVRRAR